MKTIPRLYRILNEKTGEHFTIFALSPEHALKIVPVPFPSTPDIPVKVEEVLATEASTGIQYPIYRLKDIPNNTYFKSVNIFGMKATSTVLIKDKNSYNRSTKKYDCTVFRDISLSRSYLPSHYVIIDFTF